MCFARDEAKEMVGNQLSCHSSVNFPVCNGRKVDYLPFQGNAGDDVK
jgi:hypothetical protein